MQNQTVEPKNEIENAHIENQPNEQMNDLKAHRDNAKQATLLEHQLTLWQALRFYRKAVFWSISFSMLIIMESYDLAYFGSLYAQKSFTRDFGKPVGDGTYQIPARWQTALGVTGTVGCTLGVFLDGYLTHYIGHKKLVLISLVFLTGMIFINFFAKSLPVLLVGRLLMSFPFGVFSTTPTTYASEVCPVALRGYLTTYVCLCWRIGQFLAAGVTDGVNGITNEWAYKICFALQWVWPLPLFILICFAPESPWWLVRKGRYEEAERSLQRLSSQKDINTHDLVAMMIRTDQLENDIGTGTYWDCFKGVDLRRTEIACCTWGVQALCGTAIQGYTTYFFETAGLPNDVAFKLNLGNNSLLFIGSLLTWVCLTYFGRRDIYLYGCSMLVVILFIIGFISLAPADNEAAKWAVSIMVMIQLFVYAPSTGATCYSIVGEVGAARLRSKTVCLARNTYNILEIVIGVFTPYMLNPTAGNWKGKIGFFWGVSSIFCTIWIYFRLPELAGRTYEELDLLFERKIPARKFGSMIVDAYAEEEEDMVKNKEE